MKKKSLNQSETIRWLVFSCLPEFMTLLYVIVRSIISADRGPGRVVRQPDVASAAGGHGGAQRVGGLLQRGGGIGDLHEPKVDVVGAQAHQGVVEGVEEGAARRVRDRAALAGPPGAHPGLGDEHQVTPVDVLRQQSADHLLGGPLAVGGGGVEERASGVEEDVELLLGLELVGVAAPGHRAEPHR